MVNETIKIILSNQPMVHGSTTTNNVMSSADGPSSGRGASGVVHNGRCPKRFEVYLLKMTNGWGPPIFCGSP